MAKQWQRHQKAAARLRYYVYKLCKHCSGLAAPAAECESATSRVNRLFQQFLRNHLNLLSICSSSAQTRVILRKPVSLELKKLVLASTKSFDTGLQSR